MDFMAYVTTHALTAWLNSFFGRRAQCFKIISDKSKAFIGDDIELKKIASKGREI